MGVFALQDVYVIAGIIVQTLVSLWTYVHVSSRTKPHRSRFDLEMIC